MTPETMRQYQIEERNLIAIRIKAGKRMLKDLLDCMSRDTISTEDKKNQLKVELSNYYKNPSYLRCKNMGEIVKLSLKEMLRQNKHHIDLNKKKK
jgi:hypothetical protein